MYQSYPNFYQQQQQVARPLPQQQIQSQVPQQPIFLKGRLVSSAEEVRATPIDFDGSVFFFPDLANKKIYTKQINLDGTASLNMYELKTMPISMTNENNSYITRDEFDSAMAQIKIMLDKVQPASSEAVQTVQSTPSTIQQEQPVFSF